MRTQKLFLSRDHKMSAQILHHFYSAALSLSVFARSVRLTRKLNTAFSPTKTTRKLINNTSGYNSGNSNSKFDRASKLLYENFAAMRLDR